MRRRLAAVSVTAAVLPVLATTLALTAPSAGAAPTTDTDGQVYDTARVVVPLVFPVAGGSSALSDTFLTCRSGCARHHMGQDLMGPKMTPLVATFDGVVTSLTRATKPGGGNYLTITADRGPAAGWTAVYVHVNNDTPGTDDGKGTAQWSFPAGIAQGARVLAGQLVGWRGDSGDAETTGAHLHFELRKGRGWGGTVYNAYPSLRAARRLAAPTPSGPHPDGSLMRHPTGLLFQVDGAAKRPVTPAVLAANGLRAADAVPMTAAESLGYGTSSPVPLRDGTIARDPAGTTWLVTGGGRVAVTPADLAALGRTTPRIWPVPAADLAALPVAPAVPASPLYPGALVRAAASADVQYVDAAGNRRLVDAVTRASHRWTDQDVAVLPDVPPAARRGQVLGAGPLPLRSGTLVQTPSHLVGVVSGGRFRRIWDSRMVAAYGYTGKPRLLVPTEVVRALPTAELTVR
jgi:murein DD-endopeptidase MepM/ murein hydrolase activator NlpD